jgi:hypothetical protein
MNNRLKSRRRWLIAVVSGTVIIVVIVALILVFGVFRPFESSQKNDAAQPSQPGKEDLSTFVAENPWMYRSLSDTVKRQKVNSDLAKKIIEDGQISAEEFAEVKNSYVKCETDLGFTVETLNDDGSAVINYNTADSSVLKADEKLDQECSADTDWVTILMAYGMQMHDPEDLPYGEVFYNCLVDQKVFKKSEVSYEEFEMLRSDSYSADPSLPYTDGYQYCGTAVPY